MLSGKIALVTGAAAPRGIGRAVAMRLAAEGAAVVITDCDGALRLEDGIHDRWALIEGTAQEIAAEGGKAMAMPLDVTRPGEIDTCIAATLDAFGGLDILVNNAGSLAGTGDFLSTTPDQWESSFRVNLMGPVRLCQAVIPVMRAGGGGRIINIGSTGSLGAEAGFGAYTAMKHGLVGLTKTLAAEFGPDGILCNTVCPGYIATDMHEATNARLAGEEGLDIDEIRTRRYRSVAQRRAGEPDEVARAVSFLAGPGGDYVTGINLPVSGGVPFGI